MSKNRKRPYKNKFIILILPCPCRKLNYKVFTTMTKRFASRAFLYLLLVALLFPSVLGYLQSKVRLELIGGQNRAGVILHKKPPLVVLDDKDNEDNREYVLLGSTKDENTGNQIPANLKRKVKARRDPLGHIVPRDVRKAQAGGRANPYLRPQGVAREAGLNNPSNLKILAGSAKGKRLDSPDVYLRPMMGKVREAVFSTFESIGLYNSEITTRHLDVFSGSGSVGIESLSRGARSCTFIDFSTNCCNAIERNIRWCNFDLSTSEPGSVSDMNNYDHHFTSVNRVICCDALEALKYPEKFGLFHPFEIITVCPPYEEVVYADLLHALANSKVVAEDTIILLEYPIELKCLPHVYHREDGGILLGIRNRRYGRTVIAMYIVNPTGRLEQAFSRPEEFVSV